MNLQYCRQGNAAASKMIASGSLMKKSDHGLQYILQIMHQQPILSVFLVFFLTLASPYAWADESLHFIPITPQNTSRHDGVPINFQDDKFGWQWLPKSGNHGIIATRDNPKKNAPTLRIIVKNLEPGEDYEVFGYFWTHGFGGAEGSENKKPANLPARFGLSLATLTTFGGKHISRMPWVITPQSKIAEVLGNQTAFEESKPLVVNMPHWITSKDDLRLIRARLGVARTEKDGSLPVYVDDFPDSIHCGNTLVDGVAVRLARPESVASIGVGSSKALHAALRTRDRLSVERELRAGADANALNTDGLHPLFHPASMGDQEIVKLLLDAGAKPNFPGQSVPLLTAAASTGDAPMVRLLLDAGAEIPLENIELPSWASTRRVKAAHFHPAIAAIRIGSLETLKILLEAEPDLDLVALNEFKKSDTSGFLVEDAVSMGHDKLAAFLIDYGCSLKSWDFKFNRLNYSQHPEAGLVARSITEGKSLLRTREALIRRGVPFIYPLHRNVGTKNYYSVKPWDGLSAAVCMGDLSRTKKLLLKASQMDAFYQDHLLALAWWSGQPEILRMVQEMFPNVSARHAWTDQGKAEETMKEDLRRLLPRTKNPPTRIRDQDELVLAIIPAPDAEGPAALLEVHATKNRNLTVVDRQEIDAVLSEGQFTKPWASGEHRFAEFGDLIAADALVIVSSIKGKNIELLRFEAIDVATGMAVFREHIESNSFDSNKTAQSLLKRIQSSINNARLGKRPTAITMLPFSADQKIGNSSAIADLFNTAILAEVDGTSGMLSVGMNEVQAIANEQMLKGSEGIWAAAYTLEGGVQSEPDDRTTITLRLRNLVEPKKNHIDVKVNGHITDIAELTAKAWRKLLATDSFGNIHEMNSKPNQKQNKSENKRLIREGEWLVNTGLSAESLPLFERAVLLDGISERLVILHLQALSREIRLLSKGLNILEPTKFIREYPLALPYQKKLYDNIKSGQALLDHAAYYQEHAKDSRRWEKDIFWHVVIELSFLRASLPGIIPDVIPEKEVHKFENDLDQFTADYFDSRLSSNEPSLPKNTSYSKFDTTSLMLQHNPKLLKGLVELVMKSSERKNDLTTYNNHKAFEGLLHLGIDTASRPFNKTRLVVEEMASRIDQYQGQHPQLRQIELECLMATDDRYSATLRKIAMKRSEMDRMDRHYYRQWVSRLWFRHFGISRLMDNRLNKVALHSEAMIASLVHEPLGGLDWITHPHYHTRTRILVAVENANKRKLDSYVDRLKGYEYSKLAKSLSGSSNKNYNFFRLFEAVKLWERIHGYPISKSWSDKWSRVLNIKKNQDKQKRIKARIILDLRTIDKNKPGIFTLPTFDSSNRNHMWVYYQPYENKPFIDNELGFSRPVPHRRQPWLIRFNVTSGEISTRVNLSTEPGLEPGSAAITSKGNLHLSTEFIEQTNDQILTFIKWPGINKEHAKVKESAVLINKSDGHIIPLSKPVIPVRQINMTISRHGSRAVAAVNNDFFFLHQANETNPDYRPKRNNTLEIHRISPTGNISQLTKLGRRPFLTPFDSRDRAPQMIVSDSNRLFVMHDWNHIGRYDPNSDSWIMDNRPLSKKERVADHLVASEFRSHIFPHHKIINRNENNKSYLIKWNETYFNKLAVKNSENLEFTVPIALEIPDDFYDQPVFADVIRDPENFYTNINYGNYRQQYPEGKYHIIVLNQTENDLILGLKVGSGFSWSLGKRRGRFLSLIWALPKKEFLQYAEDIE